MASEAYVTLATNDSYALGAIVLAHSLRQVGTTKHLAIVVTAGVSQPIRQQLDTVFDSVTLVNVLDSNDPVNLDLLSRPDLGVTFTKLHCWRLTQFSKCVFLDADILVLQNIDDLFERDEFSAAPDAGWPDCFNSGVFVYRPSLDTYQAMLSFAVTHGSFDGGDQGLLNAYFSGWSSSDSSKRLPFVYNVTTQTFYSYLPAIKRFGGDIKVVHFAGVLKPWHVTYNASTGRVEGPRGDQVFQSSAHYLQQWWKIFTDKVKPYMDTSVFDDRQHSWESGHVDYLGADSFENIQRQLDAKIHKRPDEKKEPGSKPADTKPAEEKVASAKAPEAKPAEAKAPEAKPAEAKTPEVKPAEAKVPEVKPAAAKAAEVKPAEVKPAQVKTSSITISSGVKPAPK